MAEKIRVASSFVKRSAALAARFVVLYAALRTRWFAGLAERMLLTAVGLTGRVSLLDKYAAEQKGLKPLNRFEKWFLAPVITAERKRRWDLWRQHCMEILFAEDPGSGPLAETEEV